MAQVGGYKYKMTDESTESILLNLSLATHYFVRGKTKILTKLKDTPGEKTNVKITKKSSKRSLVKKEYTSNPWSGVYCQRLYPSSEPGYRNITPYAKDYARIIHSPAFRRLQGKSQLIPNGENDIFRTRLTHSLEVAEIAARIAERINSSGYFKYYPINTHIVSCAGLLHDIGHPPFGHSGEEALNEKMRDFGGFEGNAQTFRIVTFLENRLGRVEFDSVAGAIDRAAASPRGLNLTAGTLASILKYPTLSTGPKSGEVLRIHKGFYAEEKEVVEGLVKLFSLNDSSKLKTIECQIMDIADDIAYSAYDLEDTLESGIVSPLDLMTLDDETLEKVHSHVLLSMGSAVNVVQVTPEAILEALASVFEVLVEIGDDSYDLINSRRSRLAFVGRTYLESIEHAKNPLIRRQYLETLIERNIDAISVSLNGDCPSLSILEIDPYCLFRMECMKAFNFYKVISSRRLRMYHHRSREMIHQIFDILFEDRDGMLLPDSVRRSKMSAMGEPQKIARIIADYISSLTDAEAMRLHDQLKSSRNVSLTAYWR